MQTYTDINIIVADMNGRCFSVTKETGTKTDILKKIDSLENMEYEIVEIQHGEAQDTLTL